jgi:hypothetical protein
MGAPGAPHKISTEGTLYILYLLLSENRCWTSKKSVSLLVVACVEANQTNITTTNNTIKYVLYTGSAADTWIDQMIKWNKPRASTIDRPLEEKIPFDKLDQFFSKPVVDHDDCPDIIAWWG